MARKFLTPIDLSKLELQNAAIQNLATAPSAPSTGQIYYDTGLKTLQIFDGGAWSPVGGAAYGAGAPATAPTAQGALYLDTTNFVLYAAKGTASTADWVPALPYGTTTANLGSAPAAGTSLQVSRADHVHQHIDSDHSAIHLNALAAATGDYSMGGHYLTNVANPVNPQDASTKAYVDAAVVGINWKPAVLAVAVTPITLSGTQTIDGVTLAAGDRVLVAGQGGNLATPDATNGIYVVSTGAWSRSSDANTSAEVTSGIAVFVEAGTLYADAGFVLVTLNPITLNTTPLQFTQFTGLGQIVAGNGLTKTGNEIDVNTASSSRIVVNPDNIDLAAVNPTSTTDTTTLGVVTSESVDTYGRTTAHTTAALDSVSFQNAAGVLGIKAGGISNTQLANSSITVTGGTNINVSTSPVALGGSTTISLTGQVAVANGGTGASTAAGARTNLGATTKITGTTVLGTTTSVNHGLGQWVLVQLFDSTTGAEVQADITNLATSGGTTDITFATSQAAGAYTYVIIG